MPRACCPVKFWNLANILRCKINLMSCSSPVLLSQSHETAKTLVLLSPSLSALPELSLNCQLHLHPEMKNNLQGQPQILSSHLKNHISWKVLPLVLIVWLILDAFNILFFVIDSTFLIVLNGNIACYRSVMSNSLWPLWNVARQLLCPLDFTGMNTGVGGHFHL